ncbi:hypothetical protein, partial [Pseudomonas sp. MWU16-30316]
NAVSETPLGEALNQKIAEYSGALGKQVADSIEGIALNEKDSFEGSLIGGGQFMAAILTGVVQGRKPKADRTSVSVKQSESSSGRNEKLSKVEEGEVGTYGETAPRSVGDGLTPDHIPSFAAVKDALRRQGVELSDSELKALRNNTNCVVVKTCSHIVESRTFGGRNSKEKIATDGSDLYKVAEADLDTWMRVWKREGWSQAKIDENRSSVHDVNKKLFGVMVIKYEP